MSTLLAPPRSASLRPVPAPPSHLPAPVATAPAVPEPVAPALASPAPRGRLDALVDATPASRERLADLLRVLSICMVVVWHWSLSLTHWNADGALVMPNPIHDVPGGWLLTWLLQVMPVFFLVGGFANLAGWQSVTRDGRGAGSFLAARMRRLLAPLLPWLAFWAALDVAIVATGRRSVLEWGGPLYSPLWFIAVYAIVVALVPVTARLHLRWGWRTLLALIAVSVAVDVLRIGLGVSGTAVGLVGSLAVWLAVHQLGYFWRDGSLLAAGWRRPAALAGLAAGTMVVLTTLGPYPRSMVAVAGDPFSNMNPTTVVIIALAALQLGLALLARPLLSAWLARRGPWRLVVAANGLAMPVFVWHMTAVLAFLWLYQQLGGTPAAEASTAWWLARPLWVLGPGLILAAMLATLARLPRPAMPRALARLRRPTTPTDRDPSGGSP